MNQKQFILSLYLAIGLIFSLGCSAGKLLVQAAPPTPTVEKTVRPTYTFTPLPTATYTPTPTFTSTSTPTPTNTLTPSPTPTPAPEEAEAAAPPPPPPAEPAPPPSPADTPTPEEPTPTPTPEFEFQVTYATHPTGSPGETRITAWIREDGEPGHWNTLAGYQVQAIAPDGNTYLSEPSGDGFSDSTVPGTGDNHWMNTKLEIRPYTPGDYRLSLVNGGIQVSPEVQINLSADPLQYLHLDFFKQKQ